MSQRCFNLFQIASIVVESMFVADGFGLPVLADFTLEPTAGIFAPRFARQCQSPLAKMLLQERFFHAQQISNADNSQIIQARLGNSTYSRNSSHIQWSQE